MCGIAGFAGEQREKIAAMTECLVHRGPDGNAIHVGNGISLGHARLAILDPRPEGDQPMWNDDRTIVIVYNGEIFNFRELRERNKLRCKTNTDTEVLLRLYEERGMEFVSELLGMFAFAIYDMRDNSWHLARDPSGIKPLFLTFPDNTLHFASEMRALMKALPRKPKINLRALSHYMRLQYVPGPETLCEGIESLPPGTILTVKNGKAERTHVEPLVATRPMRTRTECIEEIPKLMESVVHDHFLSDRPIGLFLSGGMDSSIVLHHMRSQIAGPIKTFTVRFDATDAEGAARFNADAELAKLTSEHYKTDHTEVFLSAETCRDVYRDAARALDQPNADAVSPAMYILSQEAKKHVDVALTGAGGDEIFGGYPRYRVARMLHALRFVPPSLRKVAAKLTGHPSDVLGLTPGAKLALRLLGRPVEEIQNVAHGDWFDAQVTEQFFDDHYPVAPSHPVGKMMEFDRHVWLVDESLRLTDALTMASGLEARVPFLDPRIIAALAPTDARWHVTWKRTKALLKDTYRPHLPDHLFTLKKASFYPPLAKWIRRECSPLVDEALASKRIAEYFDVQKLAALHDAHKKGAYHLHILSSVMQLHYWFETVYDA